MRNLELIADSVRSGENVVQSWPGEGPSVQLTSGCAAADQTIASGRPQQTRLNYMLRPPARHLSRLSAPTAVRMHARASYFGRRTFRARLSESTSAWTRTLIASRLAANS